MGLFRYIVYPKQNALSLYSRLTLGYYMFSHLRAISSKTKTQKPQKQNIDMLPWVVSPTERNTFTCLLLTPPTLPHLLFSFLGMTSVVCRVGVLRTESRTETRNMQAFSATKKINKKPWYWVELCHLGLFKFETPRVSYLRFVILSPPPNKLHKKCRK